MYFHHFLSFHYFEIFTVCKSAKGLCNIYGIHNCTDCGYQCKTGYNGDRCEWCNTGYDVVSEAVNGTIDSNGVGVKCGKLNTVLFYRC